MHVRLHLKQNAMSSTDPSRFQFSLRWLLIAMAVIAVLLGISVIAGDYVNALVVRPLVLLVVPACLLVIVVYGRQDLRAFGIGGLVPYVTILADKFPGTPLFGGNFTSRIWTLLLVVACGAAAVATRRWIDRRANAK
jgi:hypothetical protein